MRLMSGYPDPAIALGDHVLALLRKFPLRHNRRDATTIASIPNLTQAHCSLSCARTGGWMVSQPPVRPRSQQAPLLFLSDGRHHTDCEPGACVAHFSTVLTPDIMPAIRRKGLRSMVGSPTSVRTQSIVYPLTLSLPADSSTSAYSHIPSHLCNHPPPSPFSLRQPLTPLSLLTHATTHPSPFSLPAPIHPSTPPGIVVDPFTSLGKRQFYMGAYRAFPDGETNPVCMRVPDGKVSACLLAPCEHPPKCRADCQRRKNCH